MLDTSQENKSCEIPGIQITPVIAKYKNRIGLKLPLFENKYSAEIWSN